MRLSGTRAAGRHRATLPCTGVAGRKFSPLRAVAVATSTEVLASFHVTSAPTQLGQVLKVVGSAPELGKWNITDAPKMEWKDGDWVLDLAPAPAAPFEFKLVIVYSDNDAGAIWENGSNRHVQAVEGQGMRLMCQFHDPASMVLEPVELDAPGAKLEPVAGPPSTSSTSHAAPTHASPAEKPRPSTQPSLKVVSPSAPKHQSPAAVAPVRESAPTPAPTPAATPKARRGPPKEPVVMRYGGGVLTVLPYPDE